MQIHKAYKLKLYPTQEQESRLLQIIGGCRFVWNHYLEKRKMEYLNSGETLTYCDCAKNLTRLQRLEETVWLSSISTIAMQQSLRDLDVAYNKFFRKLCRFPKFKSRKDSIQSFRLPNCWRVRNNKIQIDRNTVVLARGTLPPSGSKLKSLTVKWQNGIWYAIILTEQEIEVEPKAGTNLGIDLGLTDLIIDSNGKRYANLRLRKSMQKRIKKASQDLARKQNGSKRREKAKRRLAVLHRKVANQRVNHIHQITHRITSENQAVIVCESLSVKNMMRNHKLAGGIADASWSEIVRQLEYKQMWTGGSLHKIDRFFPSSKMCNNCKFIVDKLPLSVRVWTCPSCKLQLDRDVNAAKNILGQYKQPKESVDVESKDGSQRKLVRVACSVKRRVKTDAKA